MADGGGSGGVGILGVFVGAILVVMVGVGVLFATGKMTPQATLEVRSADVAVQGLKPGTVDYLRAQDIAMTSRAAVEQQRKKR